MQLTKQKRRLVFINIVISCIASSMLATALTTALPAMAKDLHVTVATGQWLTSGYSLASGIMMPLTAFLILRFPTRRLFLTGQIFFIAGLVLCTLAPSFPLVMFSRMLQAIGGGIISSMTQVIILSIYPPQQRGTAMGWYGLSISAAPVIAPALAGVIVDVFNWQTIFYIAIGIMLVSFVLSLFLFGNVLETARHRFDLTSFAISIFAFSGITLGIGNIGRYHFFSLPVFATLAVGCVASASFIFRQLRLPTPFLELRVFQDKRFTISIISSMLLYLVMMGSSVLMPLYAQSILGYSATASGLIVLPGALVMAAISPVTGKIYDRLGMKLLYSIGALCLLASSFGMCFVAMDTSVWVAAGLHALRNASIACLLMPLVTWGTSSIKKELTAHGTALLNTLRTIAGAIGISVFVGIMTAVSSGSASTYGANADIHGLNISFLCMSIVSVVLLLVGVLFVKKQDAADTKLDEKDLRRVDTYGTNS